MSWKLQKDREDHQVIVDETGRQICIPFNGFGEEIIELKAGQEALAGVQEELGREQGHSAILQDRIEALQGQIDALQASAHDASSSIKMAYEALMFIRGHLGTPAQMDLKHIRQVDADIAKLKALI